MTPTTPLIEERTPSAPNPKRSRRRFVAAAVATTACVSALGVSTADAAGESDSESNSADSANELLAQADNDGTNDDNNGRNRNRNGRNGNGNGLGGFRFDCAVSHFNLDDPIVFPGEVGAAHDHMFWGNTSTDAFTTVDSLLDNEESTCEGRRDGNQASYWTPVLFDENGEALEPTDIDVRYRGRGNVNEIPNGLQMLATSDVLGAEDGDFEIEGDGDETDVEVTYPNCLAVTAAGDPVLESDDNISHTAYSDGGDCPDSHPYRIPSLQIDLEFDLDIDTEWRLSSDHEGMEQGASLHADYFAAWTDDPPGS